MSFPWVTVLKFSDQSWQVVTGIEWSSITKEEFQKSTKNKWIEFQDIKWGMKNESHCFKSLVWLGLLTQHTLKSKYFTASSMSLSIQWSPMLIKLVLKGLILHISRWDCKSALSLHPLKFQLELTPDWTLTCLFGGNTRWWIWCERVKKGEQGYEG